MTAPPNGHAERFERCFDGNYHDIARYCARRAATLEDAEDAAPPAWRWLDRMARERLEADEPPAEAARELVLGEEIAAILARDLDEQHGGALKTPRGAQGKCLPSRPLRWPM